jgi:hypothetical protein
LGGVNQADHGELRDLQKTVMAAEGHVPQKLRTDVYSLYQDVKIISSYTADLEECLKNILKLHAWSLLNLVQCAAQIESELDGVYLVSTWSSVLLSAARQLHIGRC